MVDIKETVIGIGNNDQKDEISIDLGTNSDVKPSVNFGGGIELLMNDKPKKEKSNDLSLGDIEDLENELNNLSTIADSSMPFKNETDNTKSGLFGNLFSSSKSDKASVDTIKDDPPGRVSFEDDQNLGKATSNTAKDQKTWDGYGKYAEIPIENREQSMTKEELLREKLKYLRKLEDLEKKGASVSKKYSMDDPLAELQGEYEMIINEKERSNSIKFQGRILMAAVTGLEFLNSKFDPFDLKMDGWSEQINENINDYDEIFAELHEKYKSKSKMAPELKLLFQLGGSAMMVHMTNTMFKSAMPGMDDIMRQNPELMQQFTAAAVNSMSDTAPNFSGFMGNFMPSGAAPGPQMSMASPPNPNVGTPPSPQKTRMDRSQAPQNFRRPDLNTASSEGIQIQPTFSNINDSDNSRIPMRSSRPEMKGPTNISSLLNNIKTKSVDINGSSEEKNPSTISLKELEDIANTNLESISKPRRARGKSERNSISLDI